MTWYVFTFDSTECAMDASDALASARIHFRTMPTPLAISAGCGIALRIDTDDEAVVRNAAAVIDHTECGGREQAGRRYKLYRSTDEGFSPVTTV